MPEDEEAEEEKAEEEEEEEDCGCRSSWASSRKANPGMTWLTWCFEFLRWWAAKGNGDSM
jgi:hypothetical protein